MTTDTDILPVVAPVEFIEGPRQGRWTYAEYAALPEDGQRYEIIDGVLYMTPAPNIAHQSASVLFTTHLMLHVQFAGSGRVFHAPCDVELRPDLVVQSDIIVVLNENAGIITPSHIIGAPNLIIEIASPSTAGYDRRDKQDAYPQAGVREYWIADPSTQSIELLTLTDTEYRSLGVFRGQAIIPSTVLPDLPIKAAQFFG